MLKIEALSARMKNYPGLTTITFRLNRRPESPDEMVQLTEFGGGRPEVEDAIDRPNVQIIARGPRHNPSRARDIAHAVDRFFLDSDIRPYDLGGGALILWSGRLGGPPGFLDQDELQRTLYVCNYSLSVVRTT